jgi:hypothetical protein
MARSDDINEAEAMSFFEDVMGQDDGVPSNTRERVLESASGRQLVVELRSIDRKEVLDELNSLPDEMLGALAEADDPEEAEERAREGGMLSGVNGETVGAFERICSKGIDHPELTSHQWQAMVEEFSLEVLFPLGSEIMELSLDEDDGVVDFHERG